MGNLVADVNGPFVIGYTLCFGFMGVLAVQAYIYFTRFPNDQKSIKKLVTVVLLLETLITMLTFSGFWISSTAAIVYFIAPPSYLYIPLALITGLVTTLTHGFYCWRISSLQNSRLVPIPIMMISLLQLTSIMYLSITDGLFPSTLPYTTTPSAYKLSPWLVTWLGSNVVCDSVIAISMILSFHPSKSHFGSNRSMLVKLTKLTIETGLVTAVTALAELILGIVYKEHYYHLALFYAVSKLYANCLLATLNFRLVTRSQSNPGMTAIVWDERTANVLARRPEPAYHPPHIAQVTTQAEIDMHAVIDINKTGLRKNSSISEDPTYDTFELDNRRMAV